MQTNQTSENSSCAPLDDLSDSENGEITPDASMESVLAQTAQCVAEVPRINLWI